MSKYKKKGFVIKSAFCQKNNIKISDFNETLIGLGYLFEHKHRTTSLSGFKIKNVIGNTLKAGNKIDVLHGTHQKGTFQYSEKFLNEIFNIETKPEKPFVSSEYEIDFGQYKGRLINSMDSKGEIDYCRWVMDNHFNDLSDKQKLSNKKYLAFKWFFEQKQ